MNETWLQAYIFLAFRLHRAVSTAYGCPFVEDYWGPPTWREQVETAPEIAPADLVRQAISLSDALPAQGFAPSRVIYLGKHVRAMETLARKLCGESFTLAEEATLCLDIQPVWTPEEQFEQAHALYERTVPDGTGSLAERVESYRQTVAFPQQPPDMLKEVIEQAFTEVRKRTRTFITLPEEEIIEQYFVRYMLLPEDKASSYVASLKHPLYGLHTALTYGIGQKLVRRWLQGPDRQAIFHRFLTEQWTPSQLATDTLLA
jgi:hypothetical protein